MFKSIKVGVYNWECFPAQNGFYPEDLPVDWKLSFYANEFETACITVDDHLDISLFEEWLDDLPEDFQLSLNVISVDLMEQVAVLLAQENQKINYLLASSQERGHLLQQQSIETILSSANDKSSTPGQVITLSSIWTPDNDVESVGIALLPDIDDKRLYRRWIELWMGNSSQQNLTLWLDAKTARYSSLSELRTLVELMGC